LFYLCSLNKRQTIYENRVIHRLENGTPGGGQTWSPPAYKNVPEHTSASPADRQSSIVVVAFVLVVVDQAFQRLDDLQLTVFLSFHQPFGQDRLALLEDHLER
jgi:hypothetical protein